MTNTIPLKPNTSWAEKPVALMQSPYEHTVFLDVDTTVCASLRPAFAFLDQYDFAMAPEALDLKDMHMLRRPLEQQAQQAQAQARGARGGGKDGGARAREIALPRYFEMNSGVIYYRRSAAVRDFFRGSAAATRRSFFPPLWDGKASSADECAARCSCRPSTLRAAATRRGC